MAHLHEQLTLSSLTVADSLLRNTKIHHCHNESSSLDAMLCYAEPLHLYDPLLFFPPIYGYEVISLFEVSICRIMYAWLVSSHACYMHRPVSGLII